MSKLKVLIEGYAREEGDAMYATCSTVLIEDSGKKILVDPGINKKLLNKQLKANGLQLSDIDIVFITHYHPDHMFLVALFEDSQVMDGDTIFDGDRETFFEDKIPGTTIKLIATPGHAHEQVSPVIETDEGAVVVAQDVFWWMDGKQDVSGLEALLNYKDPYVKDEKALLESRKQVLRIADWIVPGHGKMFENKFKTQMSNVKTNNGG